MEAYFNIRKILEEGTLCGFLSYRRGLLEGFYCQIEPKSDNDQTELYAILTGCLGGFACKPHKQNIPFIRQYFEQNLGKSRVSLDNHICFVVRWNDINFAFSWSDNRLSIGTSIIPYKW